MKESVTDPNVLVRSATPPRAVALRLSIPHSHALMPHTEAVPGFLVDHCGR